WLRNRLHSHRAASRSGSPGKHPAGDAADLAPTGCSMASRTPAGGGWRSRSAPGRVSLASMNSPRALRRLPLGPGRASAKSMQVAAVSALVLTALLACTPNPKSQPAPAPAATSAQPRPSPPPPPAPAAAPSVRLTPGAAHSVRFVSDLIGLADGKRLTRDAFDHAAVVVKRVSARAAVEKQRLLVLLDDQTPRPLLTW